MRITEIRVKLIQGDASRRRLRAFCSITFDNAFVVRDLKVLEGPQGFFVAMPSKKTTVRCPKCRHKNDLGSNFCAYCGFELKYLGDYSKVPSRMLYADIVHPINESAREVVHRAVIDAYEREKARAQEPGYVCAYDDFFDDYEP